MDAIQSRLALFKAPAAKVSSSSGPGNALSAFEATRDKVQRKLREEEEYRVSILAKIKVFEGLNEDELRYAAHSMTERFYAKGDFLIRQDDRGDSFFILETGVVSVQRKVNLRDANEKPVELVKLHSNSSFGEISLVTEESRSASIICESAVCKCLIMTKHTFDEIRSASQKASASLRASIGRNVLNSVKLFQDLRRDQKAQLLDAMKAVSYPPGSYICRQGSLGSNFFILVEGFCRLTLNTPNGKEKEAHIIGPGSYFGEVSLLDPASKRRVNVVSSETVTCLTLQRADYTSVMSRLDRTSSGQGGGGGGGGGAVAAASSGAGAGAGGGKVLSQLPTPLALHPDRRITCAGRGGMRDERLASTLVVRMLKFVHESLFHSHYSRLATHLLLSDAHVDLAGEGAWRILTAAAGGEAEPGPAARARLVASVQEHGRTILSQPPESRSPSEHSFVLALLGIRNRLVEVLTRGWHHYQLAELCKRARLVQVPSLGVVVESQDKNDSLYLVLRGAVRVVKGTSHEDDLTPGDVFGEGCLVGGSRGAAANYSAQAISAVDLAVFSADDFLSIARQGGEEMQAADMDAFLRRCPLFSSRRPQWGRDKYQALAQILTHTKVPRGRVVCTAKAEHDHLCLVVTGTLNVLQRMDKPRVRVLATITSTEAFGESGFINSYLPAFDRHGRPKPAVEIFPIVAATDCTLLVLKGNPRLDPDLISAVRAGWLAKNQWRKQRLEASRGERSSLRKVQREGREEGEVLFSPFNIANASASAWAANLASSGGGGGGGGGEGWRQQRPASPSPNRPASPDPATSAPRSGAGSGSGSGSEAGAGLARMMTGTRAKPSQYQKSDFLATPMPGAPPPVLAGQLRSEDLEDVPVYLNMDINPFSAVVGVNPVKAERITAQLAAIRRPRSARVQVRSAKDRMEPGFSQLVLRELGVAKEDHPLTAPRGSPAELAAKDILALAAEEQRERLFSTSNAVAAASRSERVTSPGGLPTGRPTSSGLAGSAFVRAL